MMKFLVFIMLLISLIIFVMLIGVLLSFYNGIENKVENCVQVVVIMLDNWFIIIFFDKFELQLDELMMLIEIVYIDFMFNGKLFYSYF